MSHVERHSDFGQGTKNGQRAAIVTALSKEKRMPFPLWEKRREEERDGAPRRGSARYLLSEAGEWLRGTDAETERAQSTEPHAPSGEAPPPPRAHVQADASLPRRRLWVQPTRGPLLRARP